MKNTFNNINTKLNKISNKIFIPMCLIIGVILGTVSIYAHNYSVAKKEKIRTNAMKTFDYTSNLMVKASTKNGDVNVDNGGDNNIYDPSNDKQNNILVNEQDEGVRVTLVNTETNALVTTPIDFANNPRSPIKWHFGIGNKLYYINNPKVKPVDGSTYKYQKPKYKLPKIVGGSLSSIKKYFGDETFLRDFAQLTNFNYDEMISGKYKLMLEPVGYPKIQGKIYACSATELAILDKQLNGYIRRSNIMNFSHMNLPLSMFLEKDEFGIKRWAGGNKGKQTNENIIAQLGVGAVTFIPEEEKPDPKKFEYRIDTDVYTSIEVSGATPIITYYVGGGNGSPPTKVEYENYTTVSFEIGDKIYGSKPIIYPSSSLAYVKWHTPKEPQDMLGKAIIKYKELEYTDNGKPYLADVEEEVDLEISIVKIEEKTPPNPDADDRKPKNFPDKTPEIKPIIQNEMLENKWTEYSIRKEYIPSSNPEAPPREEWIWTTYEYTAYLDTYLNLYADPLVRTYTTQMLDIYNPSRPDFLSLRRQRKQNTLKSGYGIRNKIESEIVVKTLERTKEIAYDEDGNAYWENVERESYNNDVGVSAQNAVNYFSDFEYKNYFRLSEVMELNGQTSLMEFKENPYSTYKNRTHFTPIWYPDGRQYSINSAVFDAWTPAGHLYINANNLEKGNYIYIQGNLWDDWYVERIPTYGTNPRELDSPNSLDKRFGLN